MPAGHGSRPFWTSDALVLVAATACGLALRPSVHWMDSELIPVVLTAERVRNGSRPGPTNSRRSWVPGRWRCGILCLRSPRPRHLSRLRGWRPFGCVDRSARPYPRCWRLGGEVWLDGGPSTFGSSGTFMLSTTRCVSF